jgi:uncharacterized protein
VGAQVKLSRVFQERLDANPALRVLFERSQAIPPIDAGHDFSHVLRVAEGTARIFSEELKLKENRPPMPAELDACFVSALLHDCVPVAKNSPLRKESSKLSSIKAGEWLRELKWDEMQIRGIEEAILDHSFSAGRTPQTTLAKSLQDADRLEAVGALGLYRTIATGVSMGAQLIDANDPWAENRELNDKQYSVDHFFTKLLHLHKTFQTDAAKSEAKARTEFLEQFLSQLKHEIGS